MFKNFYFDYATVGVCLIGENRYGVFAYGNIDMRIKFPFLYYPHSHFLLITRNL